MAGLDNTLMSVIRSGLEPRKIDLKREVDLSDKPKCAKFAKLISALANTPGGTAYIVVGVLDKRDRTSDLSADYVIGFEPAKADMFQQQLQQAVDQYVDPIPEIDFNLVPHLESGRMLGLITIARSFRRPHRVRRDSDDVEQGVYVRRGGELFKAAPDEIEAMRDASEASRLILNFVRPLTHAQMQVLKARLGALPEVIEAPMQFDEAEPLGAQITAMLDGLGLTQGEWQSLQFIVNLPGMAPAAAALMAEIHGRSGHFPDILRMTRTPGGGTLFDIAEIVKLQDIRDDARRLAAQA